MMKKYLVLISIVFIASLAAGGLLYAQATHQVKTSGDIKPALVQEALVQAGYYESKVDGIIGPKTRAAIRAFQSSHGLVSDGICGPKTWEKLSPYLNSEPKEPKAKPEPEPAEPEPLGQLAPDDTFTPELIRERKRALTQYELKQKLVP